MFEKKSILDRFIKPILILCGSFFLFLGIIGAIVPLLPTTPFLILTFFCYVRSSERLQRWLLTSKLYKKSIIPMIKDKGMTVKIKLFILLPVLSLLLVIFLFTESHVLKIVIVILAVGKIIVFAKIRTNRKISVNTEVIKSK